MQVFVLFTYCGVCWVFVAARGLSLVAVSRGYSPVCGARASHGRGFSCPGARALELPASVVATHGLVVAQGLGCPTAEESSLTRIKPMSPALAGGFVSTGPPRKASSVFFKCINSLLFTTVVLNLQLSFY